MTRAILVALGTGAIITSAAAISIGAGNGDSAALSRPEYEAALRSIEAERPAAAARCEALDAAERELCRTESAATETVRAADVEASYRRTQQAARAAQRARIDARYQVDRARCGTLGGFKRDKCLIQAGATKGRALLDAAAPYEVKF